MSYWTFVDMNSYFATCEQQDRPELRGLPVGVAPVLAETTCFIAASYEAKAYGIKTGTPVWEARKICPNIVVVGARPELYREFHYRIVDAVQNVCPVHEILSVDEMVCQPWGNELTLADSIRLGQKIQDAIRFEVGESMSCSIGIGPNAFLAKVASEFQKPRGLSVITMSDIPNKLFHMKLTDWPGISKGMVARFNAADVHTTQQMYALPIRDMVRVWGGINGDRWWHSIRGEIVDLPPIKRQQVGHSTVLSPEFRTPEAAFAVAARNLEKAASRMRAEGFHAQRLEVVIISHKQPLWIRRAKFLPCNRTQRFMQILGDLWEPNYAAPKAAGVVLQNIIPDGEVTMNMFDDPRRANIDKAVDRLNRRYGPGCIVSGTALPAKDFLSHVRIPFGKPSEMR